MVIALMDPVTAIALIFFPYFSADLKRFVFLSNATKKNSSASRTSQKANSSTPSVGNSVKKGPQTHP
jgi:hypothetical protein